MTLQERCEAQARSMDEEGWYVAANVLRLAAEALPTDGSSMSAEDFAAWVAHMKETRQWSKSECARRLGCGINQINIWSEKGAPDYIGYACAALAFGLPMWKVT